MISTPSRLRPWRETWPQFQHFSDPTPQHPNGSTADGFDIIQLPGFAEIGLGGAIKAEVAESALTRIGLDPVGGSSRPYWAENHIHRSVGVAHQSRLA